MAATQYAGGCRPQPAGLAVDLLALHRRAPTGVRWCSLEHGAEERVVRTIRALAKRTGAMTHRCGSNLDIPWCHEATGSTPTSPLDHRTNRPGDDRVGGRY